jgi:hypothetical protein
MVALPVLLGLLLLYACSDSTLPASTNNPPEYPGAQNVKTEEDQSGGTVLTKEITFQTADPPATVFDFYRKALLADGWKGGRVLPSEQTFRYIPGADAKGSVPEILLELNASRIDASTTDVKITFTSYPPR